MLLDKQYTESLLGKEHDPCTICSMPMLANKCKIIACTVDLSEIVVIISNCSSSNPNLF